MSNTTTLSKGTRRFTLGLTALAGAGMVFGFGWVLPVIAVGLVGVLLFGEGSSS